jgi:hypothetical protein
MSARRQIIAALSEDSMGGIATLHDVAHAEQLVDAHRTEVIAKAIGRLRAIPVTCTALTGPVWYGDGWNSAITVLEEIAEYQTPDDEAYPGELQRLRALVLGLRVAALRKEDMAQVQWLLNDHEETRKKATASAATATPELTVYRASHDSIVMGLYTTAAAAREHCETLMRRESPDTNLDWIEDEEDDVAELTAWLGGEECVTGYVVTALPVASAYDEEADE